MMTDRRVKLAKMDADMGREGRELKLDWRELSITADPGPGASEVSTTYESPEKERKGEGGTELKSLYYKVYTAGQVLGS